MQFIIMATICPSDNQQLQQRKQQPTAIESRLEMNTPPHHWGGGNPNPSNLKI